MGGQSHKKAQGVFTFGQHKISVAIIKQSSSNHRALKLVGFLDEQREVDFSLKTHTHNPRFNLTYGYPVKTSSASS
jgi:hypothetical protein